MALRRQETFRTAVRQNAMEYDDAVEAAHAATPPGQKRPGLDFEQLCGLVRSREEGEHTTAELRQRFRALDITGSGIIEKHEYLRFSLRDALARSHTRVVQVFDTRQSRTR